MYIWFTGQQLNELMKTRYFIFISFKGTSYHGWQVQPESVTVQKVLDEALSVVLNEKISTIGAGRTDTGVHARFFCAHFDSLSPDLSSVKNLVFRLNCFLPKDISVSEIRKVVPDSNARFSAISRTYKYYISRIKDPFNENTCWYLHTKLDIALMNEACQILVNNTDFTSFSKLHSDTKTNICRIYNARWTEESENQIFTIKADRFLRNMVRAIVGTMIEVGSIKLDLTEFAMIFDKKDRCSAGISAPARGLFLSDIEYPEEIFI